MGSFLHFTWNDAVKIGFVLIVEVVYFKLHQIHALTPASPRRVKPSKLGRISSFCCGCF